MRKRLIRGLGANAYDQLVTALVQLVGVPILLRAWGAQMYGEWLILFAVPAYLAMADLGFSQSAGNDMTARVASHDHRGALAVFQSLAVVVFAVATLGPVIMALTYWSLPVERWFPLKTIGSTDTHWILWLLTTSVLIGLADGLNLAGFRATGDYALHRGLSATSRMLQFSGIWIVAAAGSGPLTAAAVFLGVRIVATACGLWILLHRHRWLGLGVTLASGSELRRLYKPAMANMAIPLAQALNIQGMVLVVGALLSPIAVVVFSTLRTLTRLALQLVLAIGNTMEPEFASAFGAGDRALMRALFEQGLRAGLWMALLAAVTLLVFGPRIFSMWTHGNVQMDFSLFFWLLFSSVASVLWYGALIVLKATNKHGRAALVYAVASALALVVGWILLRSSGRVADAGVALLVMDALMTMYVLGSAAALLDVGAMASLWRALNPFPLIKMIKSA